MLRIIPTVPIALEKMWSQVCSLELIKNCNQTKIVVFLLSNTTDSDGEIGG